MNHDNKDQKDGSGERHLHEPSETVLLAAELLGTVI